MFNPVRMSLQDIKSRKKRDGLKIRPTRLRLDPVTSATIDFLVPRRCSSVG
jgi:hypothetical protein